MPLPVPGEPMETFTVTPDQLRLFLNAPETGFDAERAQLILDLAVAKCLLVVSPLTAACLPVVLTVAARAFVNPSNVFSESDVGAFAQFGSGAGGLWVMPQEKAELRSVAGTSGAFSIDLAPAVVAGYNPLYPFDNGPL